MTGEASQRDSKIGQTGGGSGDRTDWSALMRAAQDGDQGAYRVLLRAVAPYLRSLARRAGVESADLEDAVQDILLTLHRIRHSYDPDRPFAPWLTAVAHHRLVDRRRQAFRISLRETPLTESHETFAASESNSEEWAGESHRLGLAIARLPEGQRKAVELLRLREMSLAEASAASGLSVGALKVAMHRAIKSLRRILEGDPV